MCSLDLFGSYGNSKVLGTFSGRAKRDVLPDADMQRGAETYSLDRDRGDHRAKIIFNSDKNSRKFVPSSM